ncbi:hypothetical protein [Oceanobacillus profundus]|uniref:hypothetical protein n=1 Tax=Oceanobacillus profundus TaxID=372463 RepID=UPI0011C48BA4|nr:hypothetical protein [Oceanobacillus profundus]
MGEALVLREENVSGKVLFESDADLQRAKNWIEAPPTLDDFRRLSNLKGKLAMFNKNYNKEEGIIRFEPKRDKGSRS